LSRHAVPIAPSSPNRPGWGQALVFQSGPGRAGWCQAFVFTIPGPWWRGWCRVPRGWCRTFVFIFQVRAAGARGRARMVPCTGGCLPAVPRGGAGPLFFRCRGNGGGMVPGLRFSSSKSRPGRCAGPVQNGMVPVPRDGAGQTGWCHACQIFVLHLHLAAPRTVAILSA